MIYDAPCKAETNKSDIRQNSTEDMALLLNLDKIVAKHTTMTVRTKANNNLRLAQPSYKLHHDHHDRFASGYKKGDNFYLDKPPLFCSAAKNFAAEGYNKLLSRKKGFYRVLGVKDNTLHILQDVLEITISIQQATMAPASARYCNGPNSEEEGSAEEEPCFEKESEESHQNADGFYIVDKTVQRVG